MNAGEVSAIDDRVADLGAVSRDEVDHAVGHPGFLQKTHNVIVG